MANSPIVTGLPSYVEQNTLPLIAKAALGAKSAKMFELQTGVNGPTALNLLNTTVVFQDGSNCGWQESGNTELSQRTLTPAVLKVNMAFCEKKLLKTWAQYQVRIAAGDKTLPFEEDFVNSIIAEVNEAVEKMIYQGQSGQTDEFEGLISILSNSAVTPTISGVSGTAAYTMIKDVYAAIPEEALKDDTVILVSDGLYRQYIQELVAANLYHHDANEGFGEYRLPGTNTKVVAVSGLNGAADYEYIIAGRLSNMFYGCDMENEQEKVEFWYSKDNREFRLAIEFAAGVQVAWPDEIVVGKIAKA